MPDSLPRERRDFYPRKTATGTNSCLKRYLSVVIANQQLPDDIVVAVVPRRKPANLYLRCGPVAVIRARNAFDLHSLCGGLKDTAPRSRTAAGGLAIEGAWKCGKLR